MKLWSIQNAKVLEDIVQTGRHVIADFTQTMWTAEERYPQEAYDWLAEEMRQRIAPPPLGVSYPIWAWHTCTGKRKAPDMRKRDWAISGTAIVRLTLDVPEQEVLLSDFDLWHYPLNHWYLSTTEEEDARVQTWSKQRQERSIQKSWQHIYDLTSEDEGFLFGKQENRCIQACFWTLNAHDILSVEHFVAR